MRKRSPPRPRGRPRRRPPRRRRLGKPTASHALQALRSFTDGEQPHAETGQTLVTLAILEKETGNLDAAEDYARRAIDVERSGGPSRYFLAVRELAEVLLARRDCGAAEMLLRDHLRTFEKAFPAGHARLLLATSLLGESLLCQQRYEEAAIVLQRIDPESPDFRFLDGREAEEALDRLARVHEALDPSRGRP